MPAADSFADARGNVGSGTFTVTAPLAREASACISMLARETSVTSRCRKLLIPQTADVFSPLLVVSGGMAW